MSGSYPAHTKQVVIEVSTQYMGSAHTVHPLLCHGNRDAHLGHILSLTALLPPLSARNQKSINMPLPTSTSHDAQLVPSAKLSSYPITFGE